MKKGANPALAARQALRSRIVRAARSDINAFAEYVFRFKQSGCHRSLQEHMQRNARAGILAQKDLGKTTQAIARVLFRLGNNPDALIKIICASDDLAVDRVMMIRDMISRNKWLQAVFPGMVKHPGFDDWGKLSLTVRRDIFSKDSSIEACGVLTAGTGSRADEILFDDVVDYQNAIKYPALRAQVKQAFKNVWIPLLGPEGRAAYLATLHHEDDLTHELMKNSAWKWVNYSVTGDPPVSFWPEKWTTGALLARLEEIGSIEFDRSMRNVVHSDKERVIKESWIRRFTSPPDRGLRLCSWDFAASDEDGDWIARALIDVNLLERVIRVLRIDRWRGLSYNEQIDLMLGDFDSWTPDHILVESSGFQVIMGRDERLMDKPVEKIVPKVNKVQRVKQTSAFYERGFVLFADGLCNGGIEELLAFPKVKHDDRVDALTQGVLFAIEKIGKPFRPDQFSARRERTFLHGVAVEQSGPRMAPARDEGSRRGKRVGFGITKW